MSTCSVCGKRIKKYHAGRKKLVGNIWIHKNCLGKNRRKKNNG